ncbi:DciA family protein [Asaia sp. VD9]|uniref:DciA family protein n=1 Tax=Asaia sp. VD9 TaxID=3081235 RepID=UPI0038CFD09D
MPPASSAPATRTRKGRGMEAAQKEGPPERRSMTGRALGAILPQVTRPAFNKKAAPAVRLIMDWAEIVGPALAAQTEPRRVSAGTLTIACTGPVALELQHLAPQLIERINTHCGPLRSGRDLRFDDGTILVRKIRIVQDPCVMRPVTPAARPAPSPVRISDMKEGALQDTLARLGGYIRSRPRR